MKIKQATNRKEIRRLGQKKWFEHVKVLVDLTSYLDDLIPDGCFKFNNNIENVICLPTTQIFGQESFQYCSNLKLVDATPASIGKFAFQNCSNLKQFNFSQVVYIDENAFENSGLETVDLKNAYLIPNYAFASCFNLKSIHLGKARMIQIAAFSNAMIQKLFIPETVEIIDQSAFENNTFLTDVILSGTLVPKIHERAFENCPIRNVWIINQSAIDSFKNELPKNLSCKIHEVQKPIDLLPLLN